MGGKTRRVWPAAAIVVVVAAVGVLVLVVWRQPPSRRDDLSTFGGFAVAVIVPVATLVTYLAKLRKPGDADRGRSPDKLADLLAGAVLDQWRRAARERQLVQPEPIPVRWERSSRPVAGPVSAAVESRQFPPLPGLRAVGPGQLRGGGLPDLHAVYGGLGSGRLMIIGGPGSGKSGAAVLLILAALEYRAQLPEKKRPLVPVPVLFTVHGWDPGAEPIEHWLAARLRQTYPLFASRGGLEVAAGLVRAGRVAVILDGLDEIPEELRPPALQALSDQSDFRVVVLGRSGEMTAAASQQFLQGAVAIELQDVDPVAAADYLTSVQRDPPPARWDELTGRLRHAPDSPIARALSLPLTLTLVRDTYRGGDDAGELLDFCDAADPTPEAIEDYLLDRVLPAAYAPRPGEAPPRYGLAAAQLALGQVAARMNQDGTRDLAWWRVPVWASATPRVITTGLVFGLVFWLGSGGIPVFGLVAAPVAGLAYVVGGGLTPQPPRRIAPLRWRRVFSGPALRAGMEFALVGGVFGGLVFGLAAGLQSGLASGLGAAGTLFIVATIGTGLAGLLAAGLSQPAAEDASPLTPLASWQRDQAFGLMIGLVLGGSIGLGLGYIIAVRHMLNGHMVGFGYGLVVGVLYGLVFGLVWGLTLHPRWTVSLAFAQLAMSWHTPAHLLRFLDDARQRDVLRTVGPVYQFRHARLQDRLAQGSQGPGQMVSQGSDG